MIKHVASQAFFGQNDIHPKINEQFKAFDSTSYHPLCNFIVTHLITNLKPLHYGDEKDLISSSRKGN